MKKILFLTVLFFVFLPALKVLAIPYPGPHNCNIYGGTYRKATNSPNCVLKDGTRCKPFKSKGKDSCSNYKNIPCKELGESVSGVEECCQGLTAINSKSDYGGNCSLGVGGSSGICSHCGDGICDFNIEGRCNCPKDCGIVNRIQNIFHIFLFVLGGVLLLAKKKFRISRSKKIVRPQKIYLGVLFLIYGLANFFLNNWHWAYYIVFYISLILLAGLFLKDGVQNMDEQQDKKLKRRKDLRFLMFVTALVFILYLTFLFFIDI